MLRLVSLAWPEWLPPESIEVWTDSNVEGGAANAWSAAALVAGSCLALWASARFQQPPMGWIGRAGWAVLGITMAVLAWAELSDSHSIGVGWAGSGVDLIARPQWHSGGLTLTPLIPVFLLAMGGFVWKGVSNRAVRLPLLVGLLAWLVALLLDAGRSTLSSLDMAPPIASVAEEAMEVGGTLLIGMSAIIAVDPGAGSQVPAWHRLLVVSSVIAIGLGAFALAFVFRPPLVDAQLPPPSRIGVLNLRLAGGGSLVQEFGVMHVPLSGVDVRISIHDPRRGAGHAIWRIADAGRGDPQRFIAQGRIAVPANEWPRRVSIRFPPLAEATERRLALQLVADVAPETVLRIGGTQTNRYPDGRLWLNNVVARPDYNLEFVAYGAPEPTFSKLGAIGHWLASDWRWPLLLAYLAVPFTLIIFVPVLLVAHAWPLRGVVRRILAMLCAPLGRSPRSRLRGSS